MRTKKMKSRTTQPKNNKYYIRSVTGGLNDAIQGKPTISGANVLCNCVGYANGRFNEIINDPNLVGTVLPFKYQLTCNAENFIESAKKQGLKYQSTPIKGGIMVWQKGATLGGGDGAGHVAVVEKVYDDGTILTSESGYNAWAFKTIRCDNSNGRWGQSSAYKFRGCIINPTVKATTEKAPKLAIDGEGGACTVRAMQRFFGTPKDGIISGQTKSLNKYYPALTAVEYGKGGSAVVKKLQKWVSVTQDGIIGEKTVKAWQKKIGVTADGIFGANSMKVWQKYLNEHDKAVYPTVVATKAATTTSKNAKIVSKAKSYCGSKSKATATYKSASKSVYGSGNDTNCHRFVGTVLYKCGYPKMNISGKTATAWKNILAYLNKYATQVKTAKAGDIYVWWKGGNHYHIFIVTGSGKKAEAAHNKTYPHTASYSTKTKHKKDWIFRMR